MEELSFPSSSSPNNASSSAPGGGNGADEGSQQQPQQQFPMPQQQQQENNNFFNAMPHHQYFQQPYPQHFNHHQMHYPSRFVHHQHHHPFGMQTRGQFSPRARVGDWMCPNNCGLVFSSKTNCFRCGVLKPPGSVRLFLVFLSSLSDWFSSYPLSSLFFRYVFFFSFFCTYTGNVEDPTTHTARGKEDSCVENWCIEKLSKLSRSLFLSFFPLW